MRIFQREVDVKDIDPHVIEFVTKELITNAFKHGYDNKPGGLIEASYNIDEKKVTITITDFGCGFIKKDKFGKGLELMGKIFDKVEIKPAPKQLMDMPVSGKGTTIQLIKKLK